MLSLSANFLGRERPYVGSDAALFEYSGWYAIHGGVPYLHIWDPKPPVIHEIAAGLAFLSQGNVLVLHFLSSLLMGITAIATVLLISNLTYDVTNNEIAAFVSGLGMLTYPVFYLMPMAGLRPKMFVALFGTLTIYLVRSERFVAGGATAAVTAGLWQFGLFFPLLVGITAMRKSRDRFFESLSGMVSATVLIVFPCVVRDAVEPMVTQVVFSAFVSAESLRLVDRLVVGAGALDFAVPIVLGGGVGALFANNYEDATWILGGLLWFGGQVFFFDLDGGADLVPAYVFVAFGLGLLVDQASHRRVKRLALGVTGIAIVMFWWHGGLPGFVQPEQALQPETVEWLFWNQQFPESCHVRRSKMEIEFVEAAGSSLTDAVCEGTAVTRLLPLF